MEKSKISKLMAVAMAGMMVMTGCSNGKTANVSKEVNVINEEKEFTIGIVQLAEHPALDDTRIGFEEGLKELGVNTKIVYQNAQGDISTSLLISQNFASDKVDLIFAIATPAAQAAKQATSDNEIPVLFSAVSDPVAVGIVDDWNTPGGNITGTSDMAPIESQIKMFKEIDPNIKRIGVLFNTSEPNSEVQIRNLKKFASPEGLEIVEVGVSNIGEIAQGLDGLLNQVDAFYGLSDNLVVSSIELVSKKVLENNMISVGAGKAQVASGILITNGLSYIDLGKQTAKMAKEILIDGKDAGTIAVAKSEKTITTVNNKSWKALGLDENMQIFKDAVKVGE